MFGFLSSPCSLFASAPLPLSSIPCSPLPGALDRWALGAVFYWMAHTVCGITAAIFSFGTLLSRRAWDPRDTLLANGTRGSHLTIAWGAWNTFSMKGKTENIFIMSTPHRLLYKLSKAHNCPGAQNTPDFTPSP